MGNSVYNNKNTGYGASTSEGAFNGFSSLAVSGSKNLNFKVGGEYDVLECTTYDGEHYIKNSLPSLAVDTSGITEVDWYQPVIENDGTLGGDTFAVAYNGEVAEGFEVYKLFDNDSSTYGTIGTSSIYYNPEPIRITRLQYTSAKTEDTEMDHIEIYASNDNGESGWTALYDDDIDDPEAPDITLNYAGYYKYYKIVADGPTIAPSVYATCTITAKKEKKNYLTTGTYHMYVTEDDSIDINAGHYIQPTAPSNTTINTVWEDTSGSPMSLKRYNGTSWEDYNGSYIGTVTVDNGTVGVSKIIQPSYNSKEVTVPNDTKPAHIIESYTNSDKSYWYNLYSDGWVVQGYKWTSTEAETKTIELLKTMTSTTYSNIACGTVNVSSKTASELTCTCTAGECSVVVEGYISV